MSGSVSKTEQGVLIRFDRKQKFTCPDCGFEFREYTTVEAMFDPDYGFWIRANYLCPECYFDMVDTFDDAENKKAEKGGEIPTSGQIVPRKREQK